MSVRIRRLLFAEQGRARLAAHADREEAVRVMQAWNEHLASGALPLFSPTIRAARLGGYRPWMGTGWTVAGSMRCAVNSGVMNAKPDAPPMSSICRN